MSEVARPRRLPLLWRCRAIFLLAAVACCTLIGCGSPNAATLSVTTHPGDPGAATSASLRYRGNVYGAKVQSQDVPVRGSYNAILRALGSAPDEPVHTLDDALERLGADGWNVVLTDVYEKNKGRTETVVMQLARGDQLAAPAETTTIEADDHASD